MPRLDGTGPMGQGPMTGRGMGNCSGAGRGFFGRFCRWCPRLNNQALSKEEQKNLLLGEKEAIESEIAKLD